MTNTDVQKQSKIGQMLFHHATVFQVFVLFLVGILAFSIRMFTLIRYESVIHEFDPYFNFRTTKYLVHEGFYAMHNWFDDQTWYPLGRGVGGTLYPGLMWTAAAWHNVLHWLHLPVQLRNVCVFVAPVMAMGTSLVTFFIAKQVHSASAGLLAAACMAIVPAYMSRSVAGDYDNEAIALFALLLTVQQWLCALRSGSLRDAILCALCYFYMVSSWGGYVYVINLMALHAICLVLLGHYSQRLYVAYSGMFVVGSLLAMQITFVGTASLHSSEHLLPLCVFGLMQILQLLHTTYLRIGFAIIVIIISVMVLFSSFTGRFYALLNPFEQTKVPILASIAEHQPTTLAKYFRDLHWLSGLSVPGLLYCMRYRSETSVFILVYALSALYFSKVMVRLVLVLAPAVCILSGVGCVAIWNLLLWLANKLQATKWRGKWCLNGLLTVLFLVIPAVLTYVLVYSSEAAMERYSLNSVVRVTKRGDGSRIVFDDYREAYTWLRHNTKPDSKILAWWDYGYQLSAMAQRPVIVDNNTWNNTHIALVGKIFAGSEDDAYPLLQSLDVNYVLVVCGAMSNFANDDMSKLLWMVRIAGEEFPSFRAEDYLTSYGGFSIGKDAPRSLVNSLLYKLTYWRYSHILTSHQTPPGYDLARRQEMGRKWFGLDYHTERFTSRHWMVRIYEVDSPENLVP